MGCSLLTSKLKTLGGPAHGHGGAWICVLLVFIVLVILTLMPHILTVNSFLERHCGQNLSRVQGQGLL